VLTEITVLLVFILSTMMTILFLLRRPYLYVRLGSREVKIETYFI